MANVRFQKRIRLLPFLWLNLSKTGTSLTLGCRFLKINFGKRGIWFTGSLTGTGLSIRHQLKKPKREKPTPTQKTWESGLTGNPKRLRNHVVSIPRPKHGAASCYEFHQRPFMNDFMDETPVPSFGSHTRKHCDDTPATSHNHDSGSSDHHHSYNHCNDNDSPAASHSYDSCNNDSNDTCNYDY